VAVLDNGLITAAFDTLQGDLWDKVTSFLIHPNCTVALEDIRPYSLPLTPQVVDVCKFIGEAGYRLRMVCGKKFQLATRGDVKKWVFDTFPEVCRPKIEAKIDKKLFDACEILTRQQVRVNEAGRPARQPSFNYVDDQIVKVAMREMYAIGRKKKGERAPFGVESHSFQALALASFVNSVNKNPH
jgi:hypothetical protein